MKEHLLLAQENIKKLLDKIESNEEIYNAETYTEVMNLSDNVWRIVDIYKRA